MVITTIAAQSSRAQAEEPTAAEGSAHEQPAPVEPAAAASSQPSAAPRTPGLASLGLTAGIPENPHGRNSDTVAWGGLDLAIMPANRYAALGGVFSFGFGGAPQVQNNVGKVVSLAVCGELGTPLSPVWPSLHLTGSMGAGFMNGNDQGDPAQDDVETNPRLFFSYGAVLRVPVYSSAAAGGYTLAPYVSFRREHSDWLDSRASARGFARDWDVFGAGVTLFAVD